MITVLQTYYNGDAWYALSYVDIVKPVFLVSAMNAEGYMKLFQVNFVWDQMWYGGKHTFTFIKRTFSILVFLDVQYEQG